MEKRRCKIWCEYEKKLFKMVYPYMSNKELAERYGTTRRGIERQACNMKLRKNQDVINKARNQTMNELYRVRKPVIKRNVRMIYCPNHPRATKSSHGRVAESILVMESKLGRHLNPSEKVFHKDGNSLNNSIENLYLITCNIRGSINEIELIEKRKSGIGVRQLMREYKLCSFTMYKILRDYDCVNKIELNYKFKKPKLEFLTDWNK